MVTLQVDHQVIKTGLEGEPDASCTFLVREFFGALKPVEWHVMGRAAADQLVAERRQILMKSAASVASDLRAASD